MLPLQCKAQNYEWGRPFSSSEVAQLAKANGNEIDEAKPFAELWMGTHPNCPSLVAITGQGLQSWIEQHPSSLGPLVPPTFGPNLPFLFKVLSVNKSLSIQSHPDKTLAGKLHAAQPKLYPDPNHKPEMALALNSFEALCSFCSTSEIKAALNEVPELESCIGPEPCSLIRGLSEGEEKGGQGSEGARQALKSAFTSLMTCDASVVKGAVAALTLRLEKKQAQGGQLMEKEALALRLDRQYPGGDVGVLSCFFLNLLKLNPGQAIYLPANVPHAYLDGELMECMAASDNVIRAGLTPKFKDVEVLCSSLTYDQGLPEVLEGTLASGGAVRVYQPPFEEFEIHLIKVTPQQGKVALPASSGPRIMLVQSGKGRVKATRPSQLGQVSELLEEMEWGRGTVVFVPAEAAMEIEAGEGEVVVWGAAVNSAFLGAAGAVKGAAEAKKEPALA